MQRQHPRTGRLPAALLVVSAVALIGGGWFPLLAWRDPGPSAAAYGIILVSFPGWSIGALSAAAAGVISRSTAKSAALEGREGAHTTRPLRALHGIAWILCALNLAAIAACWAWSPEGIN